MILYKPELVLGAILEIVRQSNSQFLIVRTHFSSISLSSYALYDALNLNQLKRDSLSKGYLFPSLSLSLSLEPDQKLNLFLWIRLFHSVPISFGGRLSNTT